MAENNDLDKELNPDKAFDYKGSLFLTVAWLVWSIAGYFYLVIYSGTENYLMEGVYIVSAILSANSLNNRKYGFNNSIRFYKEYVILPKAMGAWSWKEEKIHYTEIDEINLIDYGNNISKNFFEIEVRTELFSYPIFGKKLQLNELKEIYNYLCDKAKVRTVNFPDVIEGPELEDVSDKSKPMRWKGYLALIALIVSGWTIIGISLSTPYSNLLSGGKIFFSSFILSIIFTYLLSKKFNENEDSPNIKKWQKIFLLGYICLYGGIAMTFSMVYINGKFDDSTFEELNMKIVSSDSIDSKKGPCYRLAVDSAGRSPSSTETRIMSFGDLHICSNNLKGAQVGDLFLLKAKNGLLSEKWIIDVAKRK